MCMPVAPDHKVKSLFATDVSGIIEWIDGSKERTQYNERTSNQQGYFHYNLV